MRTTFLIDFGLQDISFTKKSTEKYHLWHRAVLTSVDLDKRVCSVKLEHGVKSVEKRNVTAEEYNICIEDIFPLNSELYFYIRFFVKR